MAEGSGAQLTGLAGLIGAGIGGYIGYTQASAVSDLDPVMGALILGGLGMVVASAGAFVLKSAMQFVIYIILIGVFIYFFQTQIGKLTGINPVAASLSWLKSVGVPVEDIPGVDKLDKSKLSTDETKAAE